MGNQKYIVEAKERIKKSMLKDNLLIFFSRVLEDLKADEDPNLFGRVKDIYVLIRPYADYYDHEIYKFFSGEFESEEGMELEQDEMYYIEIFMAELKRDFHIKKSQGYEREN